MSNKEMIEKAEQGQWNLESDEKLLNQMKNVSQKLETRSTNTRANIAEMMLGVDETKVKLNNLSKINSIKNTHYCENLIRDDQPDDSSDNIKNQQKNEPVKLSPHVAINNGIKLMENCFEKHKVKLDPSSSNSEISTVYRPIDKYANRLPHLIGSDKWSEKWHVGLLDKDDSKTEKQQNPEETTETLSTTTTKAMKLEKDNTTTLQNRNDSMESIAKSVSSIGDSLSINHKQQDSNDDYEHESSNIKKDPIMPSSSSSMFRPQQDQRRIVNLFDDEPPSIDSSPAVARKPVNLFDDYGSVDSFPSDISDDKVKNPTTSIPTQPPVDLFNDNEFENFIEKIEKQGEGDEKEKPKSAIKKSLLPGIGGDNMKAIADEIKKVQLKKSPSQVTTKTQSEVKKSLDFKEMLNKTLVKQQVNIGEVKSMPKKEEVKSSPTPILEQKPTMKKKVTNLFDDDDEVVVDIEKKTEPVKIMDKPKEIQKKTKITNLFDDEDDDDPLEKILQQQKSKSISKTLFNEDEENKKVVEKISKSKSLFDDDENDSKEKLLTEEVSKLSSSSEKISNVIEKVKENIETKSSVIEEKSTSTTLLNVPVPFVNDEPPDDEETWETESNTFDEADNRAISSTSKTSNYSSVPIFDEIPPDDDFVPSKPPKIPEPNFMSSDEEPPKVELPKPKDENDNVSVSSGIRGKLDDLFKKKQEKDSKEISPKKIPGKLNSDLKINVGALMPGMRPPTLRKSTEDETEKKDEPEKIPSSSSSSPKSPVKEIKTEDGDLIKLLDNDLTKQRAKIQIKRRPSTRKARQESYQKTMSAYIAEEEDSKQDEASTQRMSASFSEKITKSVETFSSTRKVTSTSIFKDEEVQIKSSEKAIVTNKIPVFYDDEEDTKKLVEQKKNEKQKQTSLFGDESDDELFGKRPTTKGTTSSSAKTSKSLFGEDDDDDSLFASKTTTITKKLTTKSKLFESDDDDNDKKPVDKKLSEASTSSKTKTDLPKKQSSLFGDDDDDSDDLFSSKTKSSKSSSTSTSIKSSTSTAVKKSTSKTTVDDPLKDLWND